MIKKIKKIFVITSLIIFSFLTINYYFSEKNIININKSRSSHSVNYYGELPILRNDTKDIIIFKDDLAEFKKKRKKRIWEKLISDD
tara:strand:+ start:2501 stop:2758 length:258 start_codon:yes stop_codon:yes gene_type:complete